MEEQIKKQIREYFEYIKSVYLSLFKNILSENKLNHINSLTSEMIEFEPEAEYRIKINKEFYIGLNLDKFIRNNKIDVDTFSDVNDEVVSKINYYITNQDNVALILREEFLEATIMFFIGNSDPLSYGLANIISNLISKKNNIPISNFYYKEGNLVKKFIELFGELEIYKAILNNDFVALELMYNEYCGKINSHVSFKSLLKQINKIFNVYYRSINKVYYADSLYCYTNINYDEIESTLNLLSKNKCDINKIKLERVNSVYECLDELERYKILFTNEESVQLYYAKLEVKKMLDKANEINILRYYDNVINLEKEAKKSVDKIWKYYLSYPDDLNEEVQQWYLVETLEKGYIIQDNKYFVGNLMTNDEIKIQTEDNRYKFGFIYSIKPEAVIYTSLEKIIYNEVDSESDLTFKTDKEFIEVENQTTSILMTPRHLLAKTIQEQKKCNFVLLNEKYTKKIGVICVNDGKEDNPCLLKAEDLANKYELPLIKIIE